MESIEIDKDDLTRQFCKSLYLQDEGDLTIKLSDGSNIKVISYILKHKSTVFYDMLNTEMTEKINSIIDMTTYNPSTVKCFFAYIYFNGVYNGNNIDIFFELFFLARQYKINELYIELEEKILKLLNQETFQNMLKKCKQYGDICNEIYKSIIKFVHQQAFICYDMQGYDSYRWCCKHEPDKSNSVIILAETYSAYYVQSYYACICYNLKRKLQRPQNGFDYYLEGEPIPDSAYTECCCLHRKQLIDFNKIKDLDVDVKNDILKLLYTRDNWLNA